MLPSSKPEFTKEKVGLSAIADSIIVTFEPAHPSWLVHRYEVYYRTGSGDYSLVDSVEAPEEVEISGLEPGLLYSVYVQAVNGYGASEPDPKEKTTVPAAPKQFKAATKTATSLFLQWNKVVGANSYQLLYGEDIISTVDTFFDVTGLEPATAYTFAV